METRYYLKKSATNKDGAIYFLFHHQYEQVRISTGEKIAIKDWGDGFPRKINSTIILRERLNYFKATIDNFIKQIIDKNNRVPTEVEIREQIEILLGKKVSYKTKDLLQLTEKYLEYCKLNFAPKTLQTKAIRLSFFNEQKSWSSVDDLSKLKLEKYQAKVEIEKGEIANVNNYIKDCKAFLNWLYKNEYTQTNFSAYLRKNKETEKPIISLEEKEIIKLEKHNFINPSEQKAVDLFLFCCYTGLRFSDMQKVSKEMILNDILEIRQQKTGERVSIPLIEEAQLILKKYKDELPKISNQKANKYLKDAFETLKLNRIVTITSHTKNKIIESYFPLNQVISFHDARRTFITLALIKGIDTTIVMKLSGHKQFSVFKKYVELTNTAAKIEIDKISRIK